MLPYAKSQIIFTRKAVPMNKTPLQIFEERNEKDNCLNCAKLIIKHTPTGHINFCGESGKIILDMFLTSGRLRDCKHERKENNVKIQRNIRITAIPTKDIEGLENGKEYEVDEIMMGQNSTSVCLKNIKGSFNSIDFKFMHEGKEIDIYRSALINPYKKYDGNNGICYVEG